jgi:uncharacterized protein YciI
LSGEGEVVKFVILKTTTGDRDSYRRALGDHHRYLEKLEATGTLLTAGVFDKGVGGLLLVDTVDLEEAIRIAREDPLVVAGVDRYQVHPYTPSIEGRIGRHAPETRSAAEGAVTGPIVPPPPEESFRVVDAKTHPRFLELVVRCFAPSQILEDDRVRRGYLMHAEPRGLRKLLLVMENEVAGQIEFAPPEASGLPVSGQSVTVIHCLWVQGAFTGLEGGRRLLAACAAQAGTDSLATIAYNASLPWLPRSFFQTHGFVTLDQVETGRFYGDLPIVAYLLYKPLRPGASPPTWDREKLLEGVDFCPAYPWLFGKRLYWGESYAWKGVVVKEGLRRPELLGQLPVLGQERVGNWTIVRFGVPQADLARAVQLVQSALVDEPTYYAHLSSKEDLIVIYPDRTFRVGLDPSTWFEALQYGIDHGIPREELVFLPHVEASQKPAR